MTNTKQTPGQAQAKRLAALYNMVPNLLWSALVLVPLVIFCYTRLTAPLLILFTALSAIPAFFSTTLHGRLHIAGNTALYKKLGVNVIKRLSQNGEAVNRMVKKKYPAYQVLHRGEHSIKSLVAQTYLFEKFHLVLLVFFGLAAFYALSKGLAGWAAFLFVSNIFYNAYPILLQQYIRIKLAGAAGNQSRFAATLPGHKWKFACKAMQRHYQKPLGTHRL